MTVVTRTPIGRLARAAALALPFALMACGGDESTATGDGVEQRRIATVASAERPATPVIRDLGGTVVAPPARTFDTPGDAYKAGEFKAAAGMYRGLVTSTPDDAHGHYMLGLSSWKAGDFTGAKAALEKSIELDPQVPKAYFNLGRVLLDLRRPDEAMEVIEKGRALDSVSSDGVRLVARVHEERGDVEGALATYRDLVLRDDSDAWGLNNLGMLLLKRERVQEALGPMVRAVQVRPNAPLFQNNLGMVLERAGYPIAALRHYELAVRHDSGFVKAVRNVERLKAVVGGMEGAPVVEVDVRELAERYRLEVRTWTLGVPPVQVPPLDPR
jgi:tetratricopeptide (TPR) repeat protein